MFITDGRAILAYGKAFFAPVDFFRINNECHSVPLVSSHLTFVSDTPSGNSICSVHPRRLVAARRCSGKFLTR